jgi:long-subunit acyl-CoA synthetase (AMP-forming)
MTSSQRLRVLRHPDFATTRFLADDIAVLIYTSGTMGEPKGVLLSHGNCTSNSMAGVSMYPELNEEGVSLSILPWAHSYGQTAELNAMVYLGGSIGFIESVKTVVQDMALVPWVQNVVITGENRPFTPCLVVPDFAMIERCAAKHGVAGDIRQLLANEEIQSVITGDILKALEGHYSGYEIPKKFIYLTEPFTLENGMLTQTMKLKRRVVLEKFKARIDALYG